MKLTPLMTVAVARAIAEKDQKAVRPKIRPGRHLIDVTVRITGTVEVGEPFEQRLPACLPWQTMAKMAMDMLSPQCVRRIVEDVQAAQVAGELDVLSEQVDERVKPETAALFESMVDATTRTVNGKVVSRLVAERVA